MVPVRLNPQGGLLVVGILLSLAAAGGAYAYTQGLGPFASGGSKDVITKAKQSALALVEKTLAPTIQAGGSTATYSVASVLRDAELPELYVVEVVADIHRSGKRYLQPVKVEYDSETGESLVTA